ncbi:MAG TPA: alpha/beta hydrolase-fold protein [Chitinophagaceae bacterium]|nr:alpha/beta hydrolase-fold protein [Chitinophagaceae bacterium]
MKGLNQLCFLFFILVGGCKTKIKEQEDSVYSRHLQKHIKLSILSSPVPDDKNSFNLLLLNDGQDIEQLRVRKTIDSLYDKNLIQPLVVVAIHAGNRMEELGIADYPDYKNNGTDAAKYAAFVYDELYFFIKKKTGVRKFNSITMAGCSLGGLSAFNIAWDHADRINKVGVFSGSFWYRDKDAAEPGYSDDKNRLILNKIRSSRKQPHLQYWFYAGDEEEKSDRDKDGIIDVVDDTKDVINLIISKHAASPDDIIFNETKEGIHDYSSWSHVFPEFLIWAVGK